MRSKFWKLIWTKHSPRGLLIKAAAAALYLAAVITASAQPHAPLVYHGGPVLHSFEIYPIYFGNWSSADITTQQNYLTGLAGFLSGQDAPPGMQPVMAQYGVNSVTVAPGITLTVTYPSPKLDELDVENIIHTAQVSGQLPAFQSNRLMMVFLGSGLSLNTNVGCAYHDSEDSSSFFGVVPKDCSGELLVTAHEIFEAAADPQVGHGWDEAVDGCTTVINLEFGAIPGPADNTQGGTCSTTGFTGSLRYQGISGQSQVFARSPNNLDSFWIDANGAVMTNWWYSGANNGRWNTPFSIAPPGSAAPGTVTVTSRIPGHLDAFWVGYDGSVMTNWWDANANNGNWNTPFPITPPHIALPSKIAAVARAANHLDVFWIAPNGAVLTNWWDGFSGGWGSSLVVAAAGSALPGMIAAVNRMPGQLDVFWVDPNGAVMTNYWNANVNNGYWNTPFSIAGANSALAGAITAVSQNPTHLDVFWIGPDQSVRSNSWDANYNNGHWNTPYPIAKPNSAFPGAISAVSRIPNHLDVFWVSPSQSVMTTWWDASTNWAANPFPVMGGGLGRPSVLSAVARQPQQLDVFSVAWDGSVQTAYWNPTVNWASPFAIAGSGSALAPDLTQPPRPGNWAAIRDMTHIDVFWSGTDGSIMTTGSDYGTWLAAPLLIGAKGSAPANAPITGVSRQEHHTDAYWSSPSGAVMIETSDRFFNNFQWSGAWAVAYGANPGGPVTSVSRNQNHIDLFWTSSKGEVVTTAWDQFGNNGQFGNLYYVAPPNSAVPNSPVAAATRNANHVDLFWANASGAIMTTRWDPAAGWNAPYAITAAGVAPAGAPISPVARNAYHVDIYWINSNGAVMISYQDQFANNANWNGPFQITPAGIALPGTTAAAVSRIPYQVDVFWQTPQGAIMSTLWNQFSNNGQWITPYSITGPGQATYDSPLAAVARDANHVDVFWLQYLGSASTASWSAFANNGQWTQTSLMAPPQGGGGGGGGNKPPCVPSCVQ